MLSIASHIFNYFSAFIKIIQKKKNNPALGKRLNRRKKTTLHLFICKVKKTKIETGFKKSTPG